MESQGFSSQTGISSDNGTDDREARSKYWIAVYTRPRSEKKVASELANLNIESYAPIQTVVKQWSDRKKKVDCVIIPMVVFVKVDDEDAQFVRNHALIIKVLTLPGHKEPARIPEKQISQLKFMLKESNEPVVFEQTGFKQLDKVRVIRGNLSGLEGEVVRTNDGQTKLVVSIDILGGATVTINPLDLEVIND
ncbi:MAG: UpxY family transcription antiterminator [Muribaculaceae bacterium]|nr:UpxY family transcription antiterminator [Muribaculaceae bacterium]